MTTKFFSAALPMLFIYSCSEKYNQDIDKTPNVIFIYADDLGKGLLSSYGQKQFSTPNIDKIVNQGLKFNNAYSSAYSAPARFSLLTGYNDCRNDKYTITRGMPYCVLDTLLIAQREDSVYMLNPKIEPNDLHLAQVFKQAGYKTCAIGKLEWGFLSTRRQMSERGWDNYYGYLDHNRCHGHYPPFLFEDGKITMIEGNTYPFCGDEVSPRGSDAVNSAIRADKRGKAIYAENLFIDKALNYISENRDNSFFLYYPTLIPHGSITVPEVDPEVAKNENLTQFEKEYVSMITLLDKHVGLILDQLEKEGIAENTIVVFSADNGHAMSYYEEGRSVNDKFPLLNGKVQDDYKVTYNSIDGGDILNGNGSMSGLKRSSLDGGTNVPLAFYWKNHIEKGTTDQFVANYDFVPTVAEMLGIELKTEKSGISFFNVLFGKELPKNRTIIVDSQKRGPMIINNEGWKLRYINGENCFQLFNTEKDPMENNNLIDKYPEIAEELKNILTKECEIGYNKPSFAKGEFVVK
ncbi:MAG: sulfatase-like hydrolase/transferase [Rikenellaceae bacterium]